MNQLRQLDEARQEAEEQNDLEMCKMIDDAKDYILDREYPIRETD